MVDIPGTNYQVRNNQIYDGSGAQISQSDFLKKVESKEISLTADSLKMLSEQFGPDLTKSLINATGITPLTTEAANRVYYAVDHARADIGSAIEALFKLMQEQKAQGKERQQGDLKLVTETMKEQADKELEAAKTRMWAGIASGAMSAAAGVAGFAGGAVGTQASMQMGEGVSKFIDGGGKIWGAIMEGQAGNKDHEAKMKGVVVEQLKSAMDATKAQVEQSDELMKTALQVQRDIDSGEHSTAQNVNR
jgi:hypothetical protein